MKIQNNSYTQTNSNAADFTPLLDNNEINSNQPCDCNISCDCAQNAWYTTKEIVRDVGPSCRNPTGCLFINCMVHVVPILGVIANTASTLICVSNPSDDKFQSSYKKIIGGVSIGYSLLASGLTLLSEYCWNKGATDRQMRYERCANATGICIATTLAIVNLVIMFLPNSYCEKDY